MVFVKVRETYDLHTQQNKMSIIGIHTPKAAVIKRNYPGLLLQCKAYRPASCDVRIACASMLPLDPQGVGLTEGDVAPEDVFNPILYKAMSNFGMSQLDAYIETAAGNPVLKNMAKFDIDGVMPDDNPGAYDDFDLYYGLLAQTHEWKHANPQAGLSMSNLRPLVYDVVATDGFNDHDSLGGMNVSALSPGDSYLNNPNNVRAIQFKGKPKQMPMLNCTTYDQTIIPADGGVPVGFNAESTGDNVVRNRQLGVPAPQIFVACIIVPPSRLHQLFYRMVVEWTLEFSMIRSVQEITTWRSLCANGADSHYMSYSFESSKTDKTTDMVDTNVDIDKVM